MTTSELGRRVLQVAEKHEGDRRRGLERIGRRLVRATTRLQEIEALDACLLATRVGELDPIAELALKSMDRIYRKGSV